MAKIIAIANQKGGVGKTTTVINMSAAIAENKKKVLIIDSDPQGNSTTGLGIDKQSIDNTLYQLMIDDTIKDYVPLNTDVDGLDIIPTDIQLAGAEIELIDVSEREFILKNIIKKFSLNDKYDYIIIDCPPSLNILTINAMACANSVLIPLQCEFLAMEGLSQFLHTYSLIKEKMNPDLDIEGVVFTMYDNRTNLSAQVVQEVLQYLGNTTFTALIPRSIRLSEAPSFGQPINVYDKKSKGAKAYMLLAQGIMERNKK